jgi:S-formylglutathione hydrolase
MSEAFRLLSQHACFGGTQSFYEHDSARIGLPMRFSVYLPPAAKRGAVPAVMYLAGLTCNEETFAAKAGAQRVAAQLSIALIAPDTSPRGTQIEGQSDTWDFAVAASFYLDATQKPWAQHWRMESYLVHELLVQIGKQLPIDIKRLGITGHSMGGHGALTLALRHADLFKSLSAFAPICAPTQCPWGRKAFAGYLGADEKIWAQHDASSLMRARGTALLGSVILIDQGLADKFLQEQLHPHVLEAACAHVGQALLLRRHEGYDHGYYFVSSFMEDHLLHHAQILRTLSS